MPIRDVFFDYDQFVIRSDAVPVLTQNATLLLNHYSDRSIVIEGHCDERGTQAYNLVLGKRRAQAVKEYLQDLGVPAERMEIVSYGKERPFCTEHSLQCWQQNRRAHFVLK
ncbi:MAG: peptidoglycan-associated lipoprotein Pal [Nitrospirae bacterium]|nr:MAG: peptidoglycan-associated lipoprotein Pal [Nitrospirota bacterium]